MTCATTASEVTTYSGIEICLLLLLLLLLKLLQIPAFCLVVTRVEKNLGQVRISRSQVEVKVIFRRVQGHLVNLWASLTRVMRFRVQWLLTVTFLWCMHGFVFAEVHVWLQCQEQNVPLSVAKASSVVVCGFSEVSTQFSAEEKEKVRGQHETQNAWH